MVCRWSAIGKHMAILPTASPAIGKPVFPDTYSQVCRRLAIGKSGKIFFFLFFLFASFFDNIYTHTSHIYHMIHIYSIKTPFASPNVDRHPISSIHKRQMSNFIHTQATVVDRHPQIVIHT
jgi:hypothetical protein